MRKDLYKRQGDGDTFAEGNRGGRSEVGERRQILQRLETQERERYV
jgi:hypothetical protein